LDARARPPDESALDLFADELVVDPAPAVTHDLVPGVHDRPRGLGVALDGHAHREHADRHRALAEQAQQSPESRARAILVGGLDLQISRAGHRRRAGHLVQVRLGAVVAVQDRALAALLPVHDDLQRQPRAARPLGVRRALTVAHEIAPEVAAIMDEVLALSRLVSQTASARTFPVSGTGRAGLEAAMVSLLEPGDRVVVGECGRFGLLLEDLARRCDADVCVVRAEWGQALDPVAIEAALRQAPTKVLAVVHGETSTGVLQPLAELGRLPRAHDALLVADA